MVLTKQHLSKCGGNIITKFAQEAHGLDKRQQGTCREMPVTLIRFNQVVQDLRLSTQWKLYIHPDRCLMKLLNF